MTNRPRAARPRPPRSLRPLLVALPVVLLLLTGRFVAEPFAVASSSMTPTLRDGDEVLGEKLWPHLRGLRRDDLVVFRAPGTNTLMVKRVVGLAADDHRQDSTEDQAAVEPNAAPKQQEQG